MYLLAIRLMMMMLAEQQNLCVVIKIPGACQPWKKEYRPLYRGVVGVGSVDAREPTDF